MLMRLHKIRLGSRGFTLVELMIVIGIIGTLTAVAFPMISSTLPKYRIRAAARELVIDFKKAKMEAVKRNRSVLIQFTPETVGDPDNGGFYQVFVFVDDDGVPGFSPGDTLSMLKTVTMPRQVRLIDTSFTSPNHMGGYNSRGLPWGSGLGNLGKVTLTTSGGDRSYEVALSAAGRVQLQ